MHEHITRAQPYLCIMHGAKGLIEHKELESWFSMMDGCHSKKGIMISTNNA